MIIRMRKDVGKMLAIRVVDHFIKKGLNVFVENSKGKILSIAVFKSELSPDDFSTDGLPGIDPMSTKSGNDYFIANREKFVSAETCCA